MNEPLNNIYLSLGTNIGNRVDNLNESFRLLKKSSIVILRKSNIYESTPMYYTQQNNFLNMVLQIDTKVDPFDLLDIIKGIELDMGRKKNFRNHPRIIDIDILCYNNQKINTENLTIPHSRILERKFILKPMNDLCPDLILPNLTKSINQLMLMVDYNDDIVKLYKEIL